MFLDIQIQDKEKKAENNLARSDRCRAVRVLDSRKGQQGDVLEKREGEARLREQRRLIHKSS